jgi:hypothetical protein
MSTPPEFTEEELAALEAEMDRISVDDVLLQTIVSLVNLGARKAGLGGPEGPKADLEQTRQAIEGARALLPLLEARHGDKLGQIRDALSQLQMAYVQQSGKAGEAGEAPEAGSASGQAPDAEGRGPAQSSGRLWVPGQ